MYESHFGLQSNPFAASPLPEFIYEGREHREALAHFEYALTNHEAFVLLTGEVGTGKTTSVRALRRRLPAGTPMALITHTTLGPREFLEAILLGFGLEARPEEGKPALLHRLEAFLRDAGGGGGHALLVVDEAHLLGADVLEEVRLLSNLERDGGKLLQILLVGQPELETHLQRPELRQLRQRISLRYTLKPLNREETGEYIHHRLQAAGLKEPERAFPEDATNAVYALTQGLPREINVVAGQAMLNAFLEESPHVTRGHVFSAKTDYGFQGIVSRTGPGPEPGSISSPSAPRPSGRTALPRPESAPPRPASPPSPPEPPARRVAGEGGATRPPIPLPPPSLRPAPPAPAPEPAVAVPAAVSEVPGFFRDGPGLARQRRRQEEARSRNRILLGLVGAAILIAVAATVLLRGAGPDRPDGRAPGSSEPASPALAAPPPAADSAAISGAGVAGGEADPPPAAVPSPPGDRVSIQLASFRSRPRAERALERVTAATGLRGVVVSGRVGGDLWHWILLGAFATEDEARAAGAPLVQDGTIREVVVRSLPGRYVSEILGGS